jgi:hypothetical protein
MYCNLNKRCLHVKYTPYLHDGSDKLERRDLGEDPVDARQLPSSSKHISLSCTNV